MVCWTAVLTVLAAGCGRFGFGGDAQSEDLVAHFTMDDDPANRAIGDAAGGHTATCTPLTCPTSVAGRIGKGLEFDGAVDIMHVADFTELHGTELTVALWIYVDKGGRCAIKKPYADGSSDSWQIFTDSGGTPCFITNSEQVCDYYGTPIGLQQWAHVAGIWDGTNLALFVNGARAAIKTNVAPMMVDNNDVLIGADLKVYYPWQGRLDDLRIYDRALTESEIAKLAAP